MDKLIYTAFNTVNNIYDNRAVRAQNLANIAVPGYKRDLGSKSVGTAFLDNMQTLQSRATVSYTHLTLPTILRV